MSNDDPFASSESDRTFLMPSPGQRAARAAPEGDPPAAAGFAGGQEPQVPVEALIPNAGLNPLIIAASPLLNAVPQLRASLTHPNPIGLRETLAQGIRAFESKAKASGVEPQKVIGARYVLCTFLDETAASTPWGGSGVWGKQSLLVMFHNETWGGEKVFQLMAKLAENPGANRDLLELLFVVLALGFEGRYRVLDNGRAQLELLRERLLVMLRNQRGEYERELSPHWRGIEAKRNVMSLLPMWVVIAVAGLLAIGLYLGLSMSLNAKSDPVFAEIQALRAKALAPAPKVVAAAPKPRMAGFLEPEIKEGLVAVGDFGDRSIITIKGDGFFDPGSATVADKVLPLLVRIGEALNSVQGAVLITGHTDNQPIRSARFPSNWHLSQERALAVQQLLARSVKPERIKSEGRAESEPVAENSTAAGRAKNRRVEITLFVAKPGT
ncbi:MAG: DotU family type VI secretion system protein [Sterolibacteriaceae bacterium]|uniref:DotU family type VI secretion system protein n=1 Tax=Candidatus Methylophosphatis roskildensis TaxID=2899263 RepID=A0A9D7HJL3_9PROT|nr:DotU family type VI secretion system protein [Candidatus Methylophosphatis roskildensis]